MKKIRLMALLLSVTSCLMLFSVGFASWHGLIPSSTPTGGSIVVFPPSELKVGQVEGADGESKPIIGDFSPDGFMTSGDSNQGGTGGDSGESSNANGINFSDTGYLTFAITIDEKCLTGDSLTIRFKLLLEYAKKGSDSKQALPCTKYDGLTGTFIIRSEGGTSSAEKFNMVDGDPLLWSITLKKNQFSSLGADKPLEINIPFVINNTSNITFEEGDTIYYTITPLIYDSSQGGNE